MFRTTVFTFTCFVFSSTLALAIEPAKPAEDAAKAAALEKLCQAAILNDEKAFDELEKNYRDLYKHVVTLVKDKDPVAVAQAIQEVQKIGAAAKGAWPVINHAITRLELDPNVAPGGIRALAALASDNRRVVDRLLELTSSTKPNSNPSIVRTPAVQALALLSPQHVARQAEIVTAIAARFRDDIGAIEAVEAMGEVARKCPAVRRAASDILTLALASKGLRLSALKAIAHCGAAASELTVTQVKKLKLDESMPVREAATITLKELERQALIVPRLKKFSVDETAVDAPFYALAFAGVENPSDLVRLRELMRQIPMHEPTYRFAVQIVRLAGANDGDPVKLRQGAIALLADAADVHRAKRDELLPILIAGLREAESEAAALSGIAWCGAKGIRALASAKASQITKIEPLLLVNARHEDEDYRLDALLALEELEAKSPELHKVVTSLVSTSQPVGIRRVAAKLLQTAGPGQFDLADAIWTTFTSKSSSDAETTKLLETALKKIGMNPKSLAGYLGSVLVHPKASEQQKSDAMEQLIREKMIAAFGQDADSKAKTELSKRWFNTIKGDTPKIALELSRHMPAEAREIVLPFLIDQVTGYTNKPSSPRMRIEDAIESITHLGPECGENMKNALNQLLRSENVRNLKVKKSVTDMCVKFGWPVPKIELESEFVPLFNGKDLSGWEVVGKQDGVLIKDGVLTVPKGVNLVSKKEFGSFHLKMDVLLVAESFQIFGFHVPSQPSARLMRPQLGILIVDNQFRWRAGQFSIGSLEHTPSEGKLAKAPADCFTKRGEWQPMEIVVNKGQILIVVNDMIAVKGDLATLAKVQINAVRPILARGRGHFVIASDSKHVEYRNMRIKELK